MSGDSSKPREAQASLLSSSGTRRNAPWSLARAVTAGIVSYFAAQIVAGVVIGLYPLVRHWDKVQSNSWLTNSVYAQFCYIFTTESLTILVLWLFLRRFKSGVRAGLGLSRLPQAKDVLYALGGVIVYFGVYLLVLGVVNSVVPVNTNQQQDVGFQGAHNSIALAVTFISLVILPPIVEEITFRGLLYSGLRTRFRPMMAGLGASLLFAAPHLLTGKGDGLLWIAAIDTFSLSIVLCFLREKTGVLYSGMLVHAIKNGIAFVMLFIIIS